MDTRQLAAFCAVVDRGELLPGRRAAGRDAAGGQPPGARWRSASASSSTAPAAASSRPPRPALYRNAQRMLHAEEQLLEDAGLADDGVLAGTLTLGASTGPGAHLVPLLLCEFQRHGTWPSRSRSPTRTRSSTASPTASSNLDRRRCGATGRCSSSRWRRTRSCSLSLRAMRPRAARSPSPTCGTRRSSSCRRAPACVRWWTRSCAGRGLRSGAPSPRARAPGAVKRAAAAGTASPSSRAPIEGELAAPRGVASAGSSPLVRSTSSRVRPSVAAALISRRGAGRVIVRWGLDALPDVLAEVGSSKPLLVTSRRWDSLEPRSPRASPASSSTSPARPWTRPSRRRRRGRARRPRRRERDRHDEGGQRRDRPAGRLHPDHVLRRGVGDGLRHARPRARREGQRRGRASRGSCTSPS